MRKMMTRALGGALCLSMAALGASAASATAYTFNFQDQSAFTSTPGTFSATTAGSKLSVSMTAYHAIDFAPTSMSSDYVTSASLNWYSGYGMGVVGYGDSTSTNTHQFDNVGTGWAAGSDFVVLQFSKAVSLASIGQYVFPISGVSCCGSDVAMFADTKATSAANLDGTWMDESSFSTVKGGTTAGLQSIKLSNSPTSSVWMIGAAFNQSNDGFKLANLVVNTPAAAAVPEPASWAMMIVGFGAVGASLRARKRSVAFAA